MATSEDVKRESEPQDADAEALPEGEQAPQPSGADALVETEQAGQAGVSVNAMVLRKHHAVLQLRQRLQAIRDEFIGG